MSKLKYIIIYIPLIIVVLALIPHSPLNRPILYQIKKMAEKNWKSRIDYASADFNLWQGEVTFAGLSIETNDGLKPAWSIRIGDLLVEIDYPTWFGDHMSLTRLAIGDIYFKQHRTERAEVRTKALSSKVKTEKTDSNSSKVLEIFEKKGIRIKRLEIRGRLEIVSISDSGKTEQVKLEAIHINQKDILYDGKPDRLIRSILKGVNPPWLDF